MATARAKFVFQAVDKTRAATTSVRKNAKSVEKGFAGIRKSADKTSKAIRKSFRQAEVAVGKLATKARSAGRDLTMKLTAPVAGLGFAVLKVAAGFEAGMNRVQAKTGATGEAFQNLRNQAKALGSTTQFSARQAAEGQEILATAGLKSGQIISALPGVLNLAAAGQIEMGEAATFTATTLNGFNLEADQTNRVTDVMAKGMLLADQTVGDLGAGLAKTAGVAGVMGHSLEETAASLSVLAQKGRRAEEGGTALANLLLELNNPAGKARQHLDKLGFSIKNADGSLKSMSEILATFNAAGIGAANASDVFNRKTALTFTLLESGKGALRSNTAELQANAKGTAKSIAAANLKGLQGNLTKLKSALEGVAIAIADSGLLVWVTELVGRLGAMATHLANANPAVLRMGVLIALAAASIGPLLLGLSVLLSSIGALAGAPATFAALSATISGLAVISGPVILAIAAVVAVVIALVAAFRSGATWIENVKTLFKQSAADITATLVPAFRIVATIFNQLILPALKAVGEAIITGLAVAFRVVSTVIRVTLGPMLEALADWLGVVIPKVVNFASKAWGKFTTFIRESAGKILEFVAGALGLLGKLPGALGQGFRDGSEKLKEFAVAIGDTKVPIAEAIAGVDSFGASVKDAGDGVDLNPFDALLGRIRSLTGAATDAGDAVDGVGGEGGLVPAPAGVVPDVEPANRALTKLEQVGRRVKTSLETGLGQAMTNLHHPIEAVTDLFRSLWTSVIQEIARQLAIRLTASILSTFAGGPLGFLAAGVSGTADARVVPGSGPTLNTTTPPGQTPAPGVVNVYQTLIPVSTSDRARAGRSVKLVDQQAARFILGPATG